MPRMLPPAVGCYGDGTLGHQHTRERCADLVDEVAGELGGPASLGADYLSEELRGEMSDDAQEEYDACDWLNEHVPLDGASWGWSDGDFGLWMDDCEF